MGETSTNIFYKVGTRKIKRLKRVLKSPLTPDELNAMIREDMEASGYQVGTITTLGRSALIVYSPPDDEYWYAGDIKYDQFGSLRFKKKETEV